MNFVLRSCVLYLLLAVVSGFWDEFTSTVPYIRTDVTPRESFFRWQETRSEWLATFNSWWDWTTMFYNRRTSVVAGISIDLICLTTASILNRRTVLTAANVLDPWFNRQRDLRIWALGNKGHHKTPYRYRVWRTTRLFPKSLNPEHWHGARGIHSPRHDLCVVHSLDMIFMVDYLSRRGMYPCRSFLPGRHQHIGDQEDSLWFTGSGYEYPLHIKENYKIFYTHASKDNIVDCSKYLPKWWGKFICMKNVHDWTGIQNGGGLHCAYGREDYLFGVGSFEIRYNEDRIIAFTDIRYYIDWIYQFGEVAPGEYYEYAYPQWGVTYGNIMDTYSANAPNVPAWQIKYDVWPLGKK